MSKPLSQLSIEVSSINAIEHVLQHRPDRVRQLLVSRKVGKRIQDVQRLAESLKIPIHFKKDERDRENEPLIASLAPFSYAELNPFLDEVSGPGKALVVALDHLQDPQNFGALCRTAEALGAKAILVPKDRAVPVSAGVYHASVGAVETLPIVQVVNLGEGLRRLKEAGFWIVGASLGEGTTMPWEMPDFEKIVLVLGAELEGISLGVEKICDWRVRIPIAGQVQSLNVSAAGAVLMYEWARRAAQTPVKA